MEKVPSAENRGDELVAEISSLIEERDALALAQKRKNKDIEGLGKQSLSDLGNTLNENQDSFEKMKDIQDKIDELMKEASEIPGTISRIKIPPLDLE